VENYGKRRMEVLFLTAVLATLSLMGLAGGTGYIVWKARQRNETPRVDQYDLLKRLDRLESRQKTLEGEWDAELQRLQGMVRRFQKWAGRGGRPELDPQPDGDTPTQLPMTRQDVVRLAQQKAREKGGNR